MMADGNMPFNGFCALTSLLDLNYKRRYQLVIVCEKVNNFKGIIGRYNFDVNDVEILLYDSKGLEQYDPQKVIRENKMVQKRTHEKKWVGKIKRMYDKRNKDIYYSIPYLLWGTMGEIKRLKREERIAKEIFVSYKPDILLLCTDRGIGLVQSMIYIAKQNEIPRVVAPMTALAFVDTLMEGMRYGKKEYEVGKKGLNSKRLIEKINPKWIAEYKGEKYIFYQPWIALAGGILKRISLNPWIVGGGDATVVAVSEKGDYLKIQKNCREDIIQKKYMLTQGIEDSMVKASYINKNYVKKRISERYGLKSDKIIIYALPQLYEHATATWEVCEHNNMVIIEQLLAYDVDILISLHPKMRKDRYLYLEKMERIYIIDEALSSVIGIADVLVSLDNSSTKRWAELLGIDTVTFKCNEFEHILEEDTIEQRIKGRKHIEILEENESWTRKDFPVIIEEILK